MSALALVVHPLLLEPKREAPVSYGWTFPHDVYSLDVDAWQAEKLIPVEVLVPGARIYALLPQWGSSGTFPMMFSKLIEQAGKGNTTAIDNIERIEAFEFKVPLHGSWLLEEALYARDIPVTDYQTWWDPVRHRSPLLDIFKRDGVYASVVYDLLRPDVPIDQLVKDDRTLSVGWCLAEEMVRRRLLRQETLDLLLPHQLAGIAVAASRPASLLVWPAGRGKTLGAQAEAQTRPGGTLALVLRAVREGWAEQLREYTWLEPYAVLPQGERRRDYEPFSVYLRRMRTAGLPPFVIVALESAALYLDELFGKGQYAQEYRSPGSVVFAPDKFILDEIQKCSSPTWWTPEPGQDGSTSFKLKVTPGSKDANAETERVTRSSAAYIMSSFPSVRLRLELTASPLSNGRPRRLFGPLTHLSDRSKGPGEWGRFGSAFAYRFCDKKMVNGFPNDKGSTNIPELRDRCSFFMHEVTLAESSEGMPKTRFEIEWLRRSELAKPTQELSRMLKRLSKARQKIIAKGGDPIAVLQQLGMEVGEEDDLGGLGGLATIGALSWLRLAEASVRKTPKAMEYTAERVRGGQKVVLFTALRSDCERLARAVKTKLLKGEMDVGSPIVEALDVPDKEAREVPVEQYLRWGHGGTPPREREAARRWFRDSEGPCVLVGTGQAWGTGVDGFQVADLALILMLTWELAELVVQWKGRFDRYGGVPTLVKVLCALGTYDKVVTTELAKQVGPIKQFLAAEELDGVKAKLLGLGDPAVLRRRVLEGMKKSVFSDTSWAGG